jgi:uncharacterized protein YpuA (DUF1002 family)
MSQINFSNLAKLSGGAAKSGAAKSYDSCKSDKVSKTMKEFKEGALADRSGKAIKNKKQAIAIALSQAQTSCKYNPDDAKKLLTKVDKDLNDQQKKINLTNLIETKDAIELLYRMGKSKRVYVFQKLLWDKIINEQRSGEELKSNMWDEIKKIHDL